MNIVDNIQTVTAKYSTASDRVLHVLQEEIVQGTMVPGSKISEAELARRYGCSRGPLREALQRLAARRLIEHRPNVGARVASLSFDALIDLYQAREAIEGMAARLAAQRATGGELAEIEGLIARHARDDEVQEGRSYIQQQGDLDFHFRIAVASRNAVITHLLCDELYHLLRMYRHKFSGIPGRPRRALEEHRQIVQALLDRDGDFAELLMRRHIAGARRNIERARESAAKHEHPSQEESA